MGVEGVGGGSVPTPVVPKQATGPLAPTGAPATLEAAPAAPAPAVPVASRDVDPRLAQKNAAVDTGDEFGDLSASAEVPESPTLRRAAASQDQAELLALAQDKDPAVRQAVVRNPNAGAQVVAQVPPQDRLAVAKDGQTGPQILLNLAADRDVGVRQAVLRNDKVPIEALSILALDKSPVIKAEAVQKLAARQPAQPELEAAAPETQRPVIVPEQSTPAAYAQQARSQLALGQVKEAMRSYELAIELATQPPGPTTVPAKQEVSKLYSALAEVTFKQGFRAGEVVDREPVRAARFLANEASRYDPKNMEAQTRLNTIRALQGFDIASAREWKPGATGISGTQANARINDTYNRLDGQFNKFMGSPPLSNWMSFGKYASREAGTQIRNLETALTALNTFVTGKIVDYPQAAQNLVLMMEQDKMVEQGIRMGAKMAGVNLPEGLTATNLAAALASAGPQLLVKILEAVDKLHTAMVEGNTRIFENITPAYDIFLQAEGAGRSGLDALKGAGYGNAPNLPDEQGFVMAAFTRYKEAQELGVKAAATANSKEKDELLAKREKLMGEANLYIGLQEQMVILQKSSIFGDPTVSKMLGAMGGTMSFTLPNGKINLLPSGGDWSDFATRMGLLKVNEGTPGAIPVRHHDGSTHFYVPNPDQKGLEGTILKFFTDYLSGSNSDVLRVNPPRPLEYD